MSRQPRLPVPLHTGLWTVMDPHDVIHLVDIRHDKGGFWEGRFMWETGEIYIFIDDILKAGFNRWRAVLNDAERERIQAARAKNARKLAKLTATPEAQLRCAALEAATGEPMTFPTPNTTYDDAL
jgi:hypothetical protein